MCSKPQNKSAAKLGTQDISPNAQVYPGSKEKNLKLNPVVRHTSACSLFKPTCSDVPLHPKQAAGLSPELQLGHCLIKWKS